MTGSATTPESYYRGYPSAEVFEMKLIDVWRSARVFVVLLGATLVLYSIAVTLKELTSPSDEWWIFLILTGGFGPATMLLFRFRLLVASARIRRIMVGISWTVGLALPFVLFVADNSGASVRSYLHLLATFLLGLCAAQILWLSGLGIWIAANGKSAKDAVEPGTLLDVGTAAAENFAAHFVADADAKLLRIAARLYGESEGMRRLSIQTLIIVGALIILAAMVVLFAGFITSIDIRGVSPVQKAQDYLATARDSEQRALEQLQVVEAFQRMKREPGEHPERLIEALREGRFIDDLRHWGISDLSLQDPEKLVSYRKDGLERARANRKAMEKLVIDAQSADVFGDRSVTYSDDATTQQNEIASGNTTEALIAAGITRFGIVILIMFLAQALINLYRYALRLSAFYRTRALMLILTGGDPTQMQEAVKSLSPDHLYLGREPKSSIDDVVKLAEAAKALK